MNTPKNSAVIPWGVRGSFPMTGSSFREFGGNTSCFSIDFGGELLIFDAGSGIIRLGAALADSQNRKKIHILISHLHLDHIQGLMGFSPIYEPDLQIFLYGAKRGEKSFEQSLSAVLAPPYWPVRIKDFESNLRVFEFTPGETFKIGEISVKTAESNHPNGSVMYRVQKGDISVVYSLDCECTEEFAPSINDFAKDSSLLIWDSNFTEDDLKPGWGHSTWRQGIETAKRSGAERILMTHYNQNYSDAFLREQENLAEKEWHNCIFAREGEEISL